MCLYGNYTGGITVVFLKAKILERLISGYNRYFKVNLFSRQTQNLVQFHSGGEDYNPPNNAEGLGGSIGENPANGFIFAWRDSTERTASPGEKRLYSINSNNEVVSEIWLKNNGNITITVNGDCNIVANTANINATKTNLGIGGNKIARLGDEVTVTVPTHGSCTGTITSSGINTSI